MNVGGIAFGSTWRVTQPADWRPRDSLPGVQRAEAAVKKRSKEPGEMGTGQRQPETKQSQASSSAVTSYGQDEPGILTWRPFSGVSLLPPMPPGR